MPMELGDAEQDLLWTIVLCKAIDIPLEDWASLSCSRGFSRTSVPNCSVNQNHHMEDAKFDEPLIANPPAAKI